MSTEVLFVVNAVLDAKFEGTAYKTVEGSALVEGQRRNHSFSIYPGSRLAELPLPKMDDKLTLVYDMYLSKGKLQFGLQAFRPATAASVSRAA